MPTEKQIEQFVRDIKYFQELSKDWCKSKRQVAEPSWVLPDELEAKLIPRIYKYLEDILITSGERPYFRLP